MESVSELVSTSIEGVAGAEQDATTKAKRWDWATQWSFPKSETLSLIVPGLFGYRMLAPGADAYWGGIGRDPAWDKYFRERQPGSGPDFLPALRGRRLLPGCPRGAPRRLGSGAIPPPKRIPV